MGHMILAAEGALTLDQWRQVEALGATLTPAQARWISGYFAGLDAGMLRGVSVESLAPPVAAMAPASGGRTLTILCGTETGNATEVAKALAETARTRGLAPELVDMAHYKPRRLKDEQDLLIVVSTYGEGDPPQPATGFFDYVESGRAPKLDGLRFAVLALGDSTYEFYCEAGKRLDRRLEELGGKRLRDRVDCDIDYDDPAEGWRTAMVEMLSAEKPTGAAAPAPSVFPTKAVHDKRNPFAATVLENIAIVGRESSKETRHIELDLGGSGLIYEPGDALGVAASNDAGVVAELLAMAGIAEEATVSVKGETVTFGEALRDRYEIGQASPRFIEQWARISGSAELGQLLDEDRGAERVAFLRDHHVIDIMRRFPVSGLEPDAFLAGLRPLQPRLYSIASSLAFAPDEVHLTLSPVRYSLHGTGRAGVASAHLADRGEMGSTSPVYVQSNPHFRLPADDVPVIMIGAGTGVAPYRAFLQEREARGAGGRSWLFFGERNFRSDFLYQAEWQDHLKSGLLTRMDVAFSRDPGGKVYVQDRMRERAADLFAWLEEGAHLYVCGDAAAMAPDVNEALTAIIESEGGLGRQAAEDYVRKLQAEHRYQRDVY
ncbi:assimilatory sulfite reductase (NADPH) flavoprotein subunit [Enterovirga sp. GCM10030262]|uniref:assimilatory sulfite reductase (NADPH) flavoprotein subunit n=1 Tax=Enterovirga sp. GCM10030262 TaxID=3273391 RepID=UPI003620E05D